MRFLILLIVLFSCEHTTVWAADSLYFKGMLSVEKSASYRYQLVLGRNGSNWTGYTILDAGGPNETRSSVSAQFSKARGSLQFAEQQLLSSRSEMKDFCFVGAVLKMNAGKKELRGLFAGKDKQNKLCGTGKISFGLPEAARALMTPDGKRDSVMTGVLTKHKSESFQAVSPTLSLEIWDGGLEDHDSLQVSLNGSIVLPAFEIAATRKVVSLQLKKGRNVLLVRALNEGTEKPNSARILLRDSGGEFSLVSFLKVGEEARLTIDF